MNVPTREELYQMIEEAREAGDAAAHEVFRQLVSDAVPGKLLDGYGGGHLILFVDGRTRFGKFIKSIMDNPLPNASVSDSYFGGYELYIKYLARPYQERSVCIAREEAALKILKARLGVEGYVRPFDD